MQEIAGIGLMFPFAARRIAVDGIGMVHPWRQITLVPIKGLEYVEEAVTALGSSTELATHLFRECWVEGTGSGEFCWNLPGGGVPCRDDPARQGARALGPRHNAEYPNFREGSFFAA
jgi:hypothetical protein